MYEIFTSHFCCLRDGNMKDAIQGKKIVEIGQCCSILSVVHINFLVLSSTLDTLGTTKS